MVVGDHGSPDLTRWLLQHAQRPEEMDAAVVEATKTGHLECIKLLQEFCSPECYTQALTNAAIRGHFEVVQWLHGSMSETVMDQMKDLATSVAVSEAAAHGHLDIAMWLHENVPYRYGVVDVRDAINVAAENGHLSIVQWLHANGLDVGTTKMAMDGAAKNNHLDVVKWLHENRHEGCTVNAMDAAASIEMVEWLHANRTEGCTAQAMVSAATKGDLETLLFLHKHYRDRLVLDVSVAVWAYLEDHVDVFQWLRSTYPAIMTDAAIREDMSRYSGWSPQYTPRVFQR